MRLDLASLAILILAGCQTTAEPPVGDLLTPAQIRTEWTSRPLRATSVSSGNSFTVTFAADGTMSLNTASGFSDTGRWRPSDTGYCTTWRTIRNGAEECYTVRKSGQEYRIYKLNGTLDAKANPA